MGKIKLNHEKILHDLNVDLEKIESRCTNERKVAESRTNGCVLNPSLTLFQITAKLRRIQEQKRRNPTEAARRQRDDILKVYQERQSLFRVQKSNLDSLRKLSTKMEESNCRRKDHFVIIRKFVSKRVRRQFNHDSEKFSQDVWFVRVKLYFTLDHLQYGHRVFINIDHRTRELNFVFRNHVGEKVEVEVNSLSGGEKSCTQMCLLSSLWTTMTPPFR